MEQPGGQAAQGPRDMAAVLPVAIGQGPAGCQKGSGAVRDQVRQGRSGGISDRQGKQETRALAGALDDPTLISLLCCCPLAQVNLMNENPVHVDVLSATSDVSDLSARFLELRDINGQNPGVVTPAPDARGPPGSSAHIPPQTAAVLELRLAPSRGLRQQQQLGRVTLTTARETVKLLFTFEPVDGSIEAEPVDLPAAFPGRVTWSPLTLRSSCATPVNVVDIQVRSPVLASCRCPLSPNAPRFPSPCQIPDPRFLVDWVNTTVPARSSGQAVAWVWFDPARGPQEQNYMLHDPGYFLGGKPELPVSPVARQRA